MITCHKFPTIFMLEEFGSQFITLIPLLDKKVLNHLCALSCWNIQPGDKLFPTYSIRLFTDSSIYLAPFSLFQVASSSNWKGSVEHGLKCLTLQQGLYFMPLWNRYQFYHQIQSNWIYLERPKTTFLCPGQMLANINQYLFFDEVNDTLSVSMGIG